MALSGFWGFLWTYYSDYDGWTETIVDLFNFHRPSRGKGLIYDAIWTRMHGARVYVYSLKTLHELPRHLSRWISLSSILIWGYSTYHTIWGWTRLWHSKIRLGPIRYVISYSLTGTLRNLQCEPVSLRLSHSLIGRPQVVHLYLSGLSTCQEVGFYRSCY